MNIRYKTKPRCKLLIYAYMHTVGTGLGGVGRGVWGVGRLIGGVGIDEGV